MAVSITSSRFQTTVELNMQESLQRKLQGAPQGATRIASREAATTDKGWNVALRHFTSVKQLAMHGGLWKTEQCRSLSSLAAWEGGGPQRVR